MREFLELLRLNRNYRYTWMGQVVSEVGDHFNNIAVFALAMELTHSGLVVTGIMLARAVPASAHPAQMIRFHVRTRPVEASTLSAADHKIVRDFEEGCTALESQVRRKRRRALSRWKGSC
jgi:hypothetical protein